MPSSSLPDDLRHHDPYWRRVGPLLPACLAYVQQGDYTAYHAYWLRRVRGTAYHTPAAEAARPQYMADLLDAIRRGDCPPVRVTKAQDGTLWPWDGSHRACLQYALGLPVPYVIHNH